MRRSMTSTSLFEPTTGRASNFSAIFFDGGPASQNPHFSSNTEHSTTQSHPPLTGSSKRANEDVDGHQFEAKDLPLFAASKTLRKKASLDKLLDDEDHSFLAAPLGSSMAEAYCVLDIAQAERDIERAKKHLIDSRLQGVLKHAALLRLQAKTAAKRVGRAERCIGRVRNEMRQSGRIPTVAPSALTGICLLDSVLVYDGVDEDLSNPTSEDDSMDSE